MRDVTEIRARVDATGTPYHDAIVAMRYLLAAVDERDEEIARLQFALLCALGDAS